METKMKSLNMKLVVSAVGIAMLATPAFAARLHEKVHHRPTYDTTMQSNPLGTYPNGAERTGSAASVESGAEFNVDRGY